jgi:rhodanese-related sulfurtransferase
MKTIERSELQDLQRSGEPLTVLEALPKRLFVEGHIPGAKLFPEEQVAAQLPELVEGLDANVVVYCANDTCKNSHIVAEHLEGMGYRNVRVYVGGKQDWLDAGLPLEK